MNVTEKFEKIGARAKFNESNRTGIPSVRLDIKNDKQGEYFDISMAGADSAELLVLDTQPKDRHLLLLAKIGEGKEATKSKFLCGHDERHWFVAAIPETAPVGTVIQAKEALKPAIVQNRQAGLKANKRNKRKNSAYIRQGEWFFIPANIKPDEMLVLKNEPIRRGGGKPHMAQFCYRSGGESVWVCGKYPNGVNQATYANLLKNDATAKSWNWRVMIKDAAVYVKGKMTHADHKTINLVGWHRIVMNEETKAAAMRQVAFLD